MKIHSYKVCTICVKYYKFSEIVLFEMALKEYKLKANCKIKFSIKRLVLYS